MCICSFSGVISMPCLSGRRFTNCNGELGSCSVILSLLWPPKQRLLQCPRCMSCSSSPWRQHPTEQKLRRICGGKIEQSASNLPGSNRDFQAGLDQHWLVHAMLGSSPLAEGRRGSAVGRQLNEEAAPLDSLESKSSASLPTVSDRTALSCPGGGR